MEKKNIKKRAPNLTEERIQEIVAITDSWTQESMTWDDLVELIEASTGFSYTRQALAKHELIRIAYEERNKDPVGNSPAKKQSGLSSLDEANRVIDQQKAEIARLKRAEALLLEQFARWAANAHKNNIDYRRLDEALEPVDRDSSTRHKVKLQSVKTV